MRRRFFLAAVGACLAAGIAGAYDASEDERQELVGALADWTDAFNEHDVASLAREYADDANVQFVSGEILEGRRAVEKAFTAYFDENDKVQTKITDVHHTFLTPEIVIEDGAWEDTGLSGEESTSRGLYTSVLVKTGGKWLVKHERAWQAAGSR